MWGYHTSPLCSPLNCSPLPPLCSPRTPCWCTLWGWGRYASGACHCTGAPPRVQRATCAPAGVHGESAHQQGALAGGAASRWGVGVAPRCDPITPSTSPSPCAVQPRPQHAAARASRHRCAAPAQPWSTAAPPCAVCGAQCSAARASCACLCGRLCGPVLAAGLTGGCTGTGRASAPPASAWSHALGAWAAADALQAGELGTQQLQGCPLCLQGAAGQGWLTAAVARLPGQPQRAQGCLQGITLPHAQGAGCSCGERCCASSQLA